LRKIGAEKARNKKERKSKKEGCHDAERVNKWALTQASSKMPPILRADKVRFRIRLLNDNIKTYEVC